MDETGMAIAFAVSLWITIVIMGFGIIFLVEREVSPYFIFGFIAAVPLWLTGLTGIIAHFMGAF